MPEKTYTAAEVQALLASATGQSDLDTIAKRPYQQIKHADGSVICYPPSEGGPLTISGLHPNDFYGVDDKGVATQNAADAVTPPAKDAADDENETQEQKDAAELAAFRAKAATPATGGTN